MADDDLTPHAGVGYTRVDDQPDVAMLVEGMENTARWAEVQQLRAWERAHLALRPGERLLDVGCGLGDASVALAADLAPGGAVQGLDASAAMLEVARQRSTDAPVPMTFLTADAQALPEDDATYDAVRSERMLQWVPDMATAVAEMARVLRPGGRLSLIDTDWRTLIFDLDDDDLARRVAAVMVASRGPSGRAGGRLLNLVRDLGFTAIDCTAATHVWTRWDPDTAPGPDGFFPIDVILPTLVATGEITAEVIQQFLDHAHQAGRDGRFFLALTMFAVSATKPPSDPDR